MLPRIEYPQYIMHTLLHTLPLEGRKTAVEGERARIHNVYSSQLKTWLFNKRGRYVYIRQFLPPLLYTDRTEAAWYSKRQKHSEKVIFLPSSSLLVDL